MNGKPADADDLRTPALFNYGHFTSMQVEHRRVRGLELHFERLQRATVELFGHALDLAAVRAHIRNIVGEEDAALSLRINVFSRQMLRDRLATSAVPDVLITVGPARHIGTTPLRLKTFRHERVLPQVKHVGTFALFHHRRLAQLAGCDDALFVDSSGAISEGSIWNIGFFDGESVIWPDAPMLTGISMQLLQKGLRERGIASTSRRITPADIPSFRSAFFTNSSAPVRAIASIDDVGLMVDADLTAMLEECYASNPAEPI